MTPRHAFKIACAAFIVLPLLGRFHVGEGNWDSVARKMVLLRLDAIAYAFAFAFAYAWARFRARILALRVPACVLGITTLGILLGQADRFATWPYMSLIIFNIASVGAVLFLPAMASVKVGATIWATPVRWVSERSYALYLMHLTMLELVLKVLQPHTQAQGYAAAALIVVGLGLGAECSFRVLEQPILRRRPAPGSRVWPTSWSYIGTPSRKAA